MTDVGPGLARVVLLNDAGRHDEALRALGPILAQAPDDVDVLGELGRTQLGRGDVEQALQTANAVVRQAPDLYYGHYLASLALLRAGDHAGAVMAAQEAIRRSPDDPRCHRTLAWAASDLKGHAGLALQAARHAVALDPQDAENHACVGTVAMDINLAIAEQALTEALRLDPSHALARHNLAVLHTNSGRLVEATEGLLSAAALDPRQSLVPLNLDRVVWRWLVRTHWGAFALYFLVRITVEEHDADGVGLVLAAPIAVAIGAGVAVWWTRATVLRLGAHARATMWRVLHRSVTYALRFWCLVVAALAVVVMGLGFTGPMRSVATNVAILAFFVGFLASWADLAIEAGKRLYSRLRGRGPRPS